MLTKGNIFLILMWKKNSMITCNHYNYECRVNLSEHEHLLNHRLVTEKRIRIIVATTLPFCVRNLKMNNISKNLFISIQQEIILIKIKNIYTYYIYIESTYNIYIEFYLRRQYLIRINIHIVHLHQ